MFDINFFINKFRAIPEENLTVGTFMEWHNDDIRCSLGHCLSKRMIQIIHNNFLKTGVDAFPKSKCDRYASEMEEARQLCLLFDLKNPRYGSELVININNGDDARYQQPTPKARILAALHDIKAMQGKEKKPERIKTVYVSVPETIKEQSQELIMS